MKKVLNLSVILAVLAAMFMFSSCSEDEDAASIGVSFNQDGKFASGETAVATITSAEKLESIELWSDGSKLKNLTIPTEKDGEYVLSITNLEDGTYILKITSKTGAKDATFTVGVSGPVVDPWDKATTKISVVANGNYLCKQGTTIYAIEIVSASATAITLKLNGVEAVLGDAANQKSFISVDGIAMSQNEAKATPKDVLFAKKAGEALLTTVTANITNPISGAIETKFIEDKE